MTKKQIYKPKPISGFPEWTPQQRAAELRMLDTIREVFESYGFANIETPAAEEIDVLVSKGGDADNEIYALNRWQDDETTGRQARLGLHYDLTVPMARYVAMHNRELTFPFKRYQMQKCWRGERPQEGRFREFMQCDIDVVDQNEVSIEFDAELPAIIYEIARKLNLPTVRIHINNRKILQGFYEALGLDKAQIVEAIRIVDKLDKIYADGVSKSLKEELNLSDAQIESALSLAQIKTPDASFAAQVRALAPSTTPLLEEGLSELELVMTRLAHIPSGHVLADMSIARGFDYYTGTVYEGKFVDYPDYSTIFAGGRYADLVSNFMNASLPGVGISIGVTRIIAKLFKENALPLGPASPTQVLVAQVPDVDAAVSQKVGHELRSRGLNVEVYHQAAKMDKQFKYAERKDIRYVWFPANADQKQHEVKDLTTGEQTPADLATWKPNV